MARTTTARDALTDRAALDGHRDRERTPRCHYCHAPLEPNDVVWASLPGGVLVATAFRGLGVRSRNDALKLWHVACEPA